jgi:hypothetical protein
MAGNALITSLPTSPYDTPFATSWYLFAFGHQVFLSRALPCSAYSCPNFGTLSHPELVILSLDHKVPIQALPALFRAVALYDSLAEGLKLELCFAPLLNHHLSLLRRRLTRARVSCKAHQKYRIPRTLCSRVA